MTSQQLPVYPGWETVRLLGRGSFGAVYEIERDLFGKKEKAALKLITIPQSDSDIEELYGNGYDDASITAHFKDFLADIVREYTLMNEMKGHTNVVCCDDIRYVQHDDGFGWDIFIRMELLTPLLKVIPTGITETQIIKIGKDICSALTLCRSRNIIHRDIKPQNIFVSRDGDYKLGDFGIAKTVEKTSGGTKIGTYNYMAPEVYNNRPYGQTADIYSLGLVMYWLLNERRMPFTPLPPETPKNFEIEQARLRRFAGEPLPAPAHGSKVLKDIVLKACAFDPKDRYQSAEEMLRTLEALGRSTVGAAPLPGQEPGEDRTVSVYRAPAPASTKPAAYVPKPVEPDDEATVGVFQKPRPAAEEKQTIQKLPGKSKKGLIWAIIGGIIVLAGICFLAMMPKGTSVRTAPVQTTIAPAAGTKNHAVQTTPAPTDNDASAPLLIDPYHAAWVAHGQYLLADGTQNGWNGKDTAVYEASALTAITLDDVKAIDENLYNALAAKEVKYLYAIDLIFGTNNAGWTNYCLIDGVLYEANGSYVFKIAQCTVDVDGDNKVYAEDQWISDPKTAHAESLTPATLFMPVWQEEADENGFSWDRNPVVIGGAGLYTLVIAQYKNDSSPKQAGFGIGLVLKEARKGIAYEKEYIAADHSYGIIGGFNDWAGDVAMEEARENVWTGEVELTAGTEFKVRADADWTYSWGAADGGNCVAEADGTYVVTIDFSSGNGVVTATLKDG